MAEAGKDDDELNIPRAALNKMIKELVPNIRIANDSRELILNCCTEFIHLLSSEANDICNKQQKKTISPEHILAGMSAYNLWSDLTQIDGQLDQNTFNDVALELHGKEIA